MVKTNEFYAQVGILLVPSVGDKFGTAVSPPPNVVNDNGIDENSRIRNMTKEEKDLLGDSEVARNLRTAATDDVELYIVLRLKRPSGGDGNPGEAFPASKVDAKYANSVIVGKKFTLKPYYVIAHEIAHVLLNGGGDDHTLTRYRVMYGGDNTSVVDFDGVVVPKRFTPDEETKMQSWGTGP